MIDEELTPAPEVVEGAETPEVGTEVDIDKSDNISQLRAYAKGLKTDLGKYKETHEYFEGKFGSKDTAELAHSIYSQFAGEEFDPDAFAKVIEQLSPGRTKQLFEKVSSTRATELAKKEVETLFGGKATPDEIKLFKQWRESGYGLGEGEDIPEALKFDSEGNPKTEEEIKFLRELNRTVRETKSQIAEKTTTEEAEKEATRQAEIQRDVETFSNDRVKILDKEFESYGLTLAETDTAEQRGEKEMIRNFIINGVSGLFLADPDSSKEYHTAVKHIVNGEKLLTRTYEPRIEKALLSIMRSKPLGRLLSSLTAPDPELEVKPEISNTGTSQDGELTKGKSTGDIISDLIAQGKLKI